METNIHYPTDSSLLADSLRVMTRSLQRLAAGCDANSLKAVDHARAAKYRVLEICRAAKSFTESSRARFKDSYGKLLKLTRQVRGQACQALEQLQAQSLKAEAGNLLTVLVAEAQLRHYLPLVDKVIAQTFITEQIFGIPGMGKYFVTSISNRDYPVIMGAILLYAILLVIANVFVDLVYAYLDPRIRYD